MGASRVRSTLALAALLLAACGESADSASDRASSPEAPAESSLPGVVQRWMNGPSRALSASLATAAGPVAYQVDSLPARGGRLVATVRFEGEWPVDTLSRPTHDLAVCRPTAVAPLRGAASGVGDVLVWLVGVTHGPADRAARRVTVSLEGCTLTPRVTRVPLATTLLVRNVDSMESQLRFSDVAVDATATRGDSTAPLALRAPTAPRALAPFVDPRAVTPLTEVARTPGLVRITDDRHPWVSGWLAVAPHPFVALTDDGGRVAFDDVPAGRYLLVAWHERLGARALPVFIEAGIEARASVVLTGAR